MASPMEHEPHGAHQTKKATLSGWIGSALEYYDFFIYATAASLIFPQIFFPVAPPGSTDIPLKIGAITFAITLIAAIAAWTARETYRVHLNDLGNPNAVPVPKAEYDRMREQSIADARLARASA